ncbi:MAG: class E sortase [Acidobacteria bacterium]|nr:class E sortase [Acidobacteriota bacterium]
MLRRLSTVLGLLLVAGGLVVAGLVGWQAWVGSPLDAAAQERAAAAQSRAWAAATAGTTPPVPASPIVRREPAFAATVAVIVVPRFGQGWSRIVRQGIDEATILNSADAGVGHYPGTAMPGGIGNFAIAAHDTGYGDAFRRVGELRVNDLLLVRTADGWYTYRFRNFQWVQPTEVGVIAPVPEAPDAVPSARLITLTTCDPPYDAQEREIAYGTFVSFRPGATPPPGVS